MTGETVRLPADRIETRLPELKPGMSGARARAEAARCLFCHDAPCITACPTGIDIPLFIRQIRGGNVIGAARTILEANALGHSCARVCPVEVLCEGACVYHGRDEPPIEIGRLQRYATDRVVHGDVQIFEAGPSTGRSVALVGGGPASIACAHELRRLGHRAVVFERSDYPGGLNTDGVAPYKMKVDESLAEIEYLSAVGIEWRTGVTVGEDVPWEALEREFDAVFLGLGLGDDGALGIEGEDLEGVYGATTLIRLLKTDDRLDPGACRSAIVVGGGNTAIDAARELKLLGVDNVRIVYRRSSERMSAYEHEVSHAVAEGIQFFYRTVPLAFEGENGRLATVRLAGVDRDLRPVGDPWSARADVAAIATGQARLVDLLEAIPGGVEHEGGRVVVDPANGRTSNPRYWCGGDLANGGAEVVNAAAEGKRAAHGIDAWMREQGGTDV